MLYRLVFFILFLFVVEWYVYQAVKTLSRLKWVHYSYILLTLGVVIYLIYAFSQFDRSIGQTQQTMITMGIVLAIGVPKMLIALFLITEDVFRVFYATFLYITKPEHIVGFWPTRIRWISVGAVSLGAVPLLGLLYGMAYGKYNYKVITQTLYFENLPTAFDGLKLTHISDIHIGSLNDENQLRQAIKLINEQPSDILLFTGDIVNSHATEMDRWLPIFREIRKHKYGNYSVLGNHDYGEYIKWPNEQAKIDNFNGILDIHQKIHFTLLRNENQVITAQNDSLWIVGVENWGHNFKKAGDLPKALSNVPKDSFKILLSHDPSHWQYEVKNYETPIQLTLSGHTHGLQFGIEIPGIVRWSPVQYVYKQWAGLYEEFGKFLYVNRGFGFHAYPGRVGIWPEITVIELKKAKKIS